MKMKHTIYLILLLILCTACGGGGGSGDSVNSNQATPIPDPPEIISITYYEWMDYASNPNPTPLMRFYEGDLVVWEVCANVDLTESSLLEFSLYWPTPFIGNPLYFFSYGPFNNTADFMCFTNFTSRAMAMEDAWLVEEPFGDWLLSWRVIDSQDQESFPLEEIFRINR